VFRLPEQSDGGSHGVRRLFPAVWSDCARIGCVTDLVLTVERRNELAALLDDEQRLSVEYPKVAEYLDMASRLPGTGDDSADAAFDLRFVHYVTGGTSQS
jgi:hypothetical protein